LLLLVLSLAWASGAAAQRRTHVWQANPALPLAFLQGEATSPTSVRIPLLATEAEPRIGPYGRATVIGVVSGALILGLGMSVACDSDCGWAFPLGALAGGALGYVVGCVIDNASVNWREPVPGCPRE
jgi:hypothetical protein